MNHSFKPLYTVTARLFVAVFLSLSWVVSLPGASIIMSNHEKQGPLWCTFNESHHLFWVVCWINYTTGYSLTHTITFHLLSLAFNFSLFDLAYSKWDLFRQSFHALAQDLPNPWRCRKLPALTEDQKSKGRSIIPSCKERYFWTSENR